MATVTKLKAAVNNKNLPILGEDGNLYNYYVGRWMNKVNALGYSPSSTEINALNAFVQNGIDNGWIDKAVYLLPFVGSETIPLAGMIPLIDNVADYEPSVESMQTTDFEYIGGKINGFKGGSAFIELPVKNYDVEGNAFSVFIDFRVPNLSTISQIDLYQREQIM